MSESREWEAEEPADPGFLGGGGPDATISGEDDPDDDAFLADGDHEEFSS